jgi:hypothetical protein
MSMSLWVLSVRLSKRDAMTTTTSGVVGWRVCELEATAKGLFIEEAEKAKPGFSIDELSCLRVPESAMRQALGLTEGATN